MDTSSVTTGQATAPERAADFHAKGVSAIGEAAEAETVTELRFQLLRSAIYHDLMCKRLTRIHRMLFLASVLLSSTAVAAFGASLPWLGQLGGAAVAVVSAVQLVWEFNSSAIRHAELRRRFYQLMADLESGATERKVRAEQTRVFPDEPAMCLRTNRTAHNLAGESIYGPGRFDPA